LSSDIEKRIAKSWPYLLPNQHGFSNPDCLRNIFIECPYLWLTIIEARNLSWDQLYQREQAKDPPELVKKSCQNRANTSKTSQSSKNS
jgi:hypothetical protein